MITFSPLFIGEVSSTKWLTLVHFTIICSFSPLFIGEVSSTEGGLRVNDLKQFEYCPRIVFYNTVMPVERKVTVKMERGKEEELRLDALESVEGARFSDLGQLFACAKFRRALTGRRGRTSGHSRTITSA